MRKILFIIFLATSVLACTKVYFGEEITPKTKTICEVDWKRVPDREFYILPGSFDIVAARVFNSEHFHWAQVDTAGSISADTLRLEPGEYQWALYASDSPYIIENIDAFKEDKAVSMRSVCARVPRWPIGDINYVFPDFEQSLVGYCDTVISAPRLFCGNLRSDVPSLSDTTKAFSIHFSPEMLSREVSFRINIEAGEGVVVNRVIANIVGIPMRVELISGLLDGNRANLGQTLFELKKDPAEPGWWSGTVKILGIVAPTSAEAQSGAGIFHVYVDEGITHRKIRRVVNLARYLQKTPIMRPTDVEDWYHGSYSPLMYRIETPLVLEKSGAVSTGDGPVSEWMEPDDGETKDIIDGQDDDEQ